MSWDLLPGDGSFIFTLTCFELKQDPLLMFISPFTCIVGSESKLCLRVLKPTLGLSFKGCVSFKGKHKTFLITHEEDVGAGHGLRFRVRCTTFTASACVHKSYLQTHFVLNYQVSHAWSF